MNFPHELKTLLATQTPLIHVATYEEERLLEMLLAMGDGVEKFGVTSWDVADGFQTHRAGAQVFPPKECNTDTILGHIAEKMPDNHVLVLRDFHNSWQQKRGYITRKLRNLVPRLRGKWQFLLMLTPPLPADQGLPRELKHDAVSLEMPLPGHEEMSAMFDGFTRKLDKRDQPAADLRHKLVESALGLSAPQARLAFTRAWASFKKFDVRAVETITFAKQEIIRESGALEYWPASAGEGDVGGLDLMKSWLMKRECGFSAEARAAALPYPRGVALTGIPGTGKSLSAKMISGLWKLPLLRLDVGAVFSSGLGDSEANIRRAIALAETVSPCLLWVDEMEKAFAGVGVAAAGASGSGAATRVFGTFLTWMQEHQRPIFVIATANEIEGLPPELMSRFDATFFLDLPNREERHAILKIHLKRALVDFRDPKLNLPELVEASAGMVGREIARAVVEAQFTAFGDSNRELEQADLLLALGEIVPVSRSHEAVIKNLQRWKNEGRARPASSEEPSPGTGPRGRTVDA